MLGKWSLNFIHFQRWFVIYNLILIFFQQNPTCTLTTIGYGMKSSAISLTKINCDFKPNPRLSLYMIYFLIIVTKKFFWIAIDRRLTFNYLSSLIVLFSNSVFFHMNFYHMLEALFVIFLFSMVFCFNIM